MRRSVLKTGAAFAALFFCVVPAHGESIEARVKTCAACHGPQGTSSLPDTPSLGGQPSFFLISQLFLFREGRRGGPMIEISRGWSDDHLRGIADHLSARLPPPAPPAGTADPARVARAQALVAKERCANCHNPDFSGHDQVPRLAYQREDYLLRAMREFRSGKRLGYGLAMSQELRGFSDDDLAEIAYYLARQPHKERAAR